MVGKSYIEEFPHVELAICNWERNKHNTNVLHSHTQTHTHMHTDTHIYYTSQLTENEEGSQMLLVNQRQTSSKHTHSCQ